MQNVTAAILHLSDLHLGKDFEDVGTRDRADGINASSMKSVLRNRGRQLMQSHDGYILPSLHLDVKSAARRLCAPAEEFDFCVVTGDISTDSSPEHRFAFARKFLTERFTVREEATGQEVAVGLNFAKERLLCVPGNHDKLRSQEREAYMTGFADLPGDLSYAHAVRARAGQQFVFYGIDSNLYEEDNTAVGSVSPFTLTWLKGAFANTAGGGALGEDAVRVLLLHHHPADLNQFRSRSFWDYVPLVHLDSFTRLREGERLLAACNGNVDIIMHGHEHFPVVFHEPISDCLVVSAGTASKFQANPHHRNSFHGLAFSGRKFE
ncbi:MAG TPA: metallophosphoesterase, partial [Pyrinomonadaceae bacterium]